MQVRSKMTMLLLTFALTSTSLLAGCFGGNDAPPQPTDGTTVVDPGETDPATPICMDQECGSLNEPAAHYHHYWNELQEVKVYDGGIPFQNMNNKYLLQYSTLAWSEFDLETDHDDVCLEDSCANKDPYDKNTGIADTVFAGTDRLTVTFPENFPQGVGAFVFWYKPSGTPKFLPENGIVITPEQRTVEIALDEVGMADPPHQFVTSRWKFRLMATNGFCSSFQLPPEACPPAMITETEALQSPDGNWTWGERGLTGLQIVAHNGGERSLDPPHPDFWTNGDIISLGMTEGSVDEAVAQTPAVRERIPALTDISMPTNRIVPLGTEKVIVKVSWNNEAPTPAIPDAEFKFRLYYHGADTLDYQLAPEITDNLRGMQVTDATYEIFDSDERQVDPPYESNSFWRFKLVPTLVTSQGEHENTGVFRGDYSLTFEAHKKPNYILT